MSTHEIKVIELPEIIKHPNADSLGIVDFGWQCIVRLGEFKQGDLVCFIEPDYNVPVDRPEFSFLKRKDNQTTERIRVKKLRGVISQGLVIKAPEGFNVGDDVMNVLGITRYEPPVPFYMEGKNESNVPPYLRGCPVYDVENFQKYKGVIQDGEEVIVTEKLHGASCRISLIDNVLYVGSRRNWKSETSEDVWWKSISDQRQAIEYFLRTFPNTILYGETWGQVQNLRYGTKNGEVRFSAFDVFQNGRWWDCKEFLILKEFKINTVPILFIGPFSDEIINMQSGMSVIENANHIREGIVIKPVIERYDNKLGRVILKLVSDEYLQL